MRTFLSELGCLPVSAMIHVPKAQDVFNVDGKPIAGQDRSSWFNYFSRTFSRLTWWAQAAKQHAEVVNPQSTLKSFKTNPSQRNAP